MSTETLPDYSAAYRGARERIIELVRDAPPERQMMIAPATPEWRVHDIVAHLAGATSDVLAGRLDGVASDPWTAVQVEDRRNVPTADVLDEWDANSVKIEPMVPDFGYAAGQIVLDVVTHEHDIRDAFAQPGARDTDAVHIATNWAAQRIAEARSEAGDGAIRFETNLWSEMLGGDEATATVRVDAFELLRASTGRRSLAQISAWEWSGDAHPELVVLAIFQPRAVDFVG
jgi:uncharacterized protein (TIGR03083 family)